MTRTHSRSNLNCISGILDTGTYLQKHESSKRMGHVVSSAWNFRYDIYIYITNTGTIPAADLVVTDTLPPGMVPWSVQVSPGGVFDGVDTVTWNLPALGPAYSTYVWIKAQTWSWAAGTSLTNIACIDAIGIPEPIRVIDTSYVHWPPPPPPRKRTPTATQMPTPTCAPTSTDVMPVVDMYYVYLPVAEDERAIGGSAQ